MCPAIDAVAELTRVRIARDKLNSGEFSYRQKPLPRPCDLRGGFDFHPAARLAIIELSGWRKERVVPQQKLLPPVVLHGDGRAQTANGRAPASAGGEERRRSWHAFPRRAKGLRK